MKIYFDESYPTTRDVVILGSVFLSDKANSYLHKKYLKINAQHKINGELKYSKITSNKMLNAANEAIRTFFAMKNGSFRASVTPYSSASLSAIPGNSLEHKRLGVYVDSAYHLLRENIGKGVNADLFMDREDRVAKTKFHKKIMRTKCLPKGSVIGSVTSVDSKDDATCLIQLCDLLTGGILQNLYPSTGKGGKYKKAFGKELKKLVGASSFTSAYWKLQNKKTHNKYYICFRPVPNFPAIQYLRKKRKKSHS